MCGAACTTIISPLFAVGVVLFAFAFTLQGATNQLLLKISARRGNNEMETTHHRVQHVEMSTALS